MTLDADFMIERSQERCVVALTGDWTTLSLGSAAERLNAALRSDAAVDVDARSLGRVDTVGVFVLTRAGRGIDRHLLQARPELQALHDLVAVAAGAAAPPTPRRRGAAERFGRIVVGAARTFVDGLAFQGRLAATLVALCRAPARLRLAATVGVMERAGLDALPIVAATSFFVGATVAFLGATLLAQFGAQVFSVELIGIGVLREFGVLITCIILAGRSGSSFAAELGAMRMNQEIAAMQTLGVDPFEALVAPRVVAMLIMTPLLSVAAMVAGLLGGLLVIWSVLDLSPLFFVDRLIDNVGVRPFFLGILKAPVMAALIATIGCGQGMRANGGVEDLGRRVTAAVVQALFAIIIADAAFAFALTEIGL